MARSSGASRVSSFRVVAPLVFAGLAYATARTTIVPVVPQIQTATASSAGHLAAVPALGTPPGSGHPSEGAFALDHGSGAVQGLPALRLVPLVRPRPRAEAAPAQRTGLTAPRIG